MKESCKKCTYWTGIGYQRYKCYTKECPAKKRNDAKKTKERASRKNKKKMKIEFKPNYETMKHDPHDYSYTVVVTNPRACRKRGNEY